jgi:hypothetical protein
VHRHRRRDGGDGYGAVNASACGRVGGATGTVKDTTDNVTGTVSDTTTFTSATTPRAPASPPRAKQVGSLLKPDQWKKLVGRISEIQNPSVPTSPSKYTLHDENKRDRRYIGD